MTRQEIVSKVAEIVRNNMPGFENLQEDENAHINTEAGYDSMTFIYVMCKIETEFDISIPKRKWEKMQTLGDVVTAIEKELAKK